MSRSTQSAVLSVIGVIAGFAALSGRTANFVTPVMRWPIMTAALVLIVIASLGFILGDRDESRGARRRRDRRSVSPLGWVVLLPFLIIGVLAPGPLGPFTATREPGGVAAMMRSRAFEPLPQREPIPMTLAEYSARALYAPRRMLEGRTFQLIGFAAAPPAGQEFEKRWTLTRMSVSCCPGGARAVKVAIEGSPPPAADQWVIVSGTWTPSEASVGDPEMLPILLARSVSQTEPPERVYE